MIATPQQSLEAAAAVARAAGMQAYILSDEMEGESREVGKVHAALARAVALQGPAFQQALRDPERRRDHGHGPAAAGAEKNPKGRGGRAGEFCMGLALALAGPARRVRAGGRHRRHRRRGRQCRRLCGARHPAARTSPRA